MKFKYYAFSLLAGTLLACSEDADMIATTELNNTQLLTKSVKENYGFQITTLHGIPCVQFDNDSAYQALLNEICTLPKTEQEAVFANEGFISQIQMMEEVRAEQEAIVDNYESDLTQPFPHQQIEMFVEKYQKDYLFNPYDSTDFIPNYKIKAPYRSFTNKEGVFLIGDSLVHAPEYTTEELFGSTIMLTRNNETTDKSSINKAESKYQIPNGKYIKVRAIVSFTGDFKVVDGTKTSCYQKVGIDYLSQWKKVLWKSHNGDIILRLSNLSGSGENGVEAYDDKSKSYITANPYILFTHVYDKHHMYFGRVGEKILLSPNSTPKYSMYGNMEIWSKEIPETNKGLGTIKLTQN